MKEKKLLFIIFFMSVIILGAYYFQTNKVKSLQKQEQVKKETLSETSQNDRVLFLISNLQEVKEFKKEVEDSGKSKPIVAIDSYPNPKNPYYLIQVYAEVPEIDGFRPTLTFGWYRVDPKTWTVMKMDLSSDDYDKWDAIDTSGHECDNYTEITKFKEPIPVVWDAKFDGCLSGCWGAAFTRVPNDPKYPRFSGYVPDNGDRIADEFMKEGQIVKIYGKWTDVSDSYGSVFDNKCVPTVEIEKIEIVK